jgi:hypothetical protein
MQMNNMDFDHDIYMINQMANSTSFYNTTNKILVSFMIYFAAVFCSSWIMGAFILSPMEEEPEKPKKKYTDKFNLKDMQQDLSRNNEVTKNTSVIESTPQGNVIMRYNKEREGFEYWCDDKNIKYDYLETVARKFVIMNFCTNLYVDRHENIKKQHDTLDELIKREKDEETRRKEEKEEKNSDENITEKKALKKEPQEEDDCVFVKSKFSVEKRQEKEKIDRKTIVAKKANKYLYMGKVSEFQWIKKKHTNAPVQEMSFSSFKSLFMKNKDE